MNWNKMAKLPGKNIPKHVGFLVKIDRFIPAAIFIGSVNRLCFFVGNQRKCGKAYAESNGKKEPFINKYLSHSVGLLGFNEFRKNYVTARVKNIFNAVR